MCFAVRWSGSRVLSAFAVALAVLVLTAGQAHAQTFTLSIQRFMDATGTVTSSPAGISCTTAKFNPVGPCSATFPAGTVVTLTAVPGEQNTFEGWTGVCIQAGSCEVVTACTGTGPCQVTLTQDFEVRPNFVATRYPVTIVGAGNGTGTIHEPLGGAFGTPLLACVIRKGEAVDPRCTTTVAYNSVIQLAFETSVAGTNRLLSYSSECATQPPGPCNALIRGPTTITATIVAQEFRVRSAGGTGTGTVTSTTGNAQINCTITSTGATGVCSKIYDNDVPTLVTLVATPGEGSRFVGWSGVCTSTPCTFFAADYPPNVPEAVALFEALPENTVKLVVNGTGGFGRGRVTSSPAGIDCDFSNAATTGGTGTCVGVFPVGTTVQLTATPRDGTKVLGFTGDCASQAATCTVVMYHDRTATVQLDPARFPITVTATGNGSGTVLDLANFFDGLTAAMRCKVTRGVADSGCTLMYPFGSTLHLSLGPFGSSKATADQTTCVTSACTVTGPFTLNTTFTAPEINIVGAGSGSGRVAGSGGAELNCTVKPTGVSGTCSTSFDLNPAATTVNFTPIPDFGSVFAGYTGLCTGIQACSTKGDYPPNTQLVARFELQAPAEFPITVTMVGTGSGTVRSTPAGIVCTRLDGKFSGNCATSFATGTNLTLTPEPATGSRFVEWGGDCTGAGSCTVTMDQVHNVTARFDPADANPIVLAIVGGGTGRGIVTIAPGSTQCTFTGVVAGDACTVSYAQPTQVTLTASAQFGSTFGGWTGDACSSTDLTCTFNITASTAVTVNFISPHSPHDLGLALTGGFTLAPNEREALDRLGNRNGVYDLGDLLAYLDRTGQKLTATDAAQVMKTSQTPAAPAATTRRVP